MNNLSSADLQRIREDAADAKAVGKNDSTAPWMRFLRDVNPDFVIAVLDELLALREAQSKPVAVVELSDYISVAEALGEVPRRKAVKELYDGALVVGQQLYTAPQLPAVPEGAEERLAAAVELLKQAAPHMLADESLKDPDGVLCGKRVIPDQLTIDDATARLSVEYILSNTGVTAFRDGWNACLSAIASAPKPEGE